MVRRWLCLFLLVILPLQHAHAAAAAYCQHETGRAAAHFGHHAHEHHEPHGAMVAAKATKDAAKASLSAQLDQDCGVCHLGGLQSLPHRIELTLPASLPAPPPVAMTVGFSSLSLSQIDRPNWPASR